MKILLLFSTLLMGINTFSCEKVTHRMALPIEAKYTDVYIPIDGPSMSAEFIESNGAYCMVVFVTTDNIEAAEFNYKFDASDKAIEIPFYAVTPTEMKRGSAVFKFPYNPSVLKSNRIGLKVEIQSPYGGTKAVLNEKFAVKH